MKSNTYLLHTLLRRICPAISLDDAVTLRRASMTLHRWAERECGDGNECIERDEATGRPYSVREAGGRQYRTRVPDREAGALRRVAAICGRLGLHYWHQADPRGCALYIAALPLHDHDYERGVAVC